MALAIPDVRAVFVDAIPEAHAAEAPKTSSLSWIRLAGAEQCIPNNVLAQSVEHRLGRKVFVSSADAELSVEGTIQKRPGGGWRALITLRDAKGTTIGTRELERKEASCEAMTDPIVLVVALLIDPDAMARPRPLPTVDDGGAAESGDAGASSDPPPIPPQTPDAGPPVVPTPLPADRRSRPKAEPWRMEGGVHGHVVNGLGPSPAVGAGVNAILYPPGIPVGFRGFTSLFLPTTAEQDGARATFDMLLLGGELCPTLRGRVNVMGCVGGHLGGLRPNAKTNGRGIDEDARVLLDAAFELRLSLPLVAPIGATMGVGAAVPLLRPRFPFARRDGTEGEIHRTGAVVLSADVGIGFFFP